MTKPTQTDLQASALPWNFDNGAYLKDANGKTIGDFRYKNAKADVSLILSSIARAALSMDEESAMVERVARILYPHVSTDAERLAKVVIAAMRGTI